MAVKSRVAGLTVTVVVAEATTLFEPGALNENTSGVAEATAGAMKVAVLELALVRVTAGPDTCCHRTPVELDEVPVRVTSLPELDVPAAPADTEASDASRPPSPLLQAARPNSPATANMPPMTSRRDPRAAMTSSMCGLFEKLTQMSPSSCVPRRLVSVMVVPR